MLYQFWWLTLLLGGVNSEKKFYFGAKIQILNFFHLVSLVLEARKTFHFIQKIELLVEKLRKTLFKMLFSK